MITKRAFVSFDEPCPYKCKHCFSFEAEHISPPRSIDQIVDSLQHTTFDVVYVSQKCENLINGDAGISLCESIFLKYRCNIVIITRCILTQAQQERVLHLQKIMREHGKHLFIGISLVGLDSSSATEDLTLVPSPQARIDFAKALYRCGIPVMILIRPLFPSKLIPCDDWLKIIDQIAGNVSCVVSGALMVNDAILNRLKLHESELHYLEGGESEYLDGAISGSMKFVDVRNEMHLLKEYCSKKNVAFFEHSIPAINYLAINK